jgi:hypothetical protein
MDLGCTEDGELRAQEGGPMWSQLEQGAARWSLDLWTTPARGSRRPVDEDGSTSTLGWMNLGWFNLNLNLDGSQS